MIQIPNSTSNNRKNYFQNSQLNDAFLDIFVRDNSQKEPRKEVRSVEDRNSKNK